MQGLALWLYGLLAWLAQPLLRAKLRRRAVAEPGYAQAVAERFGRYGAPPPAPGALWLHAVSLGETRAAALLLRELRALCPGLRVLLTHGTATGRAEGESLLQPGDLQCWLPWDTPGATRRFLRHHRPCVGVLLETEVWPQLAAACRAQSIPLALVNARLNDKSWRGARRLALLARPAYAGLAGVWAQSAADARRLADVGAPVRAVTGNLKFDFLPDAQQLACGRRWRDAAARPVVLLASTREGEESMWLEVLRSKWPETLSEPTQAAPKFDKPWGRFPVQWLLVPRHPQRFDEVARLCAQAGLSVARRSQWAPQAALPPDADVWLGDSLGEMALYYGMAQVALLGGSFAPLGGQNLIEAAACACPVVLGPHTFNFAQAAELALAAGAAERVADMARGVDVALALAQDAAQRPLRQARSLAFAAGHRGAARASAQAIAALLSS